jgi:CRP-like cAMP-binding protein
MVSSQIEAPASARPAQGSAVSLAPGLDMGLLQKAPLFRDLTPDQITRFLSIGTPHVFPAGEQFITEGNTDTDTFVVYKGKVDILKKLPPVLPGGQEQLKSLVQVVAPNFGIFAFGAPNMLGGLGRSASIVALEDCETIIVTKEAYERLALEDPLLGYYMTRNIALNIIKDLNDTNQRVVKLTQALTLALQQKRS